MDLTTTIKQLSEKFYSEILNIRRHIHAHPELSFEEFDTSEYICSKLDEWGIPYKGGIVKTGIVAVVEGKRPGKVIGLRADMDALPINEKNEVPYKSLNAGKMHACGHDVHTASLLGAIRILNELREEISGKIKFVFQPGEERTPGGAKLMLEENLFGDEPPELMIAQHVYPDLETGQVGFREGLYMASSDELFITVKGKGGHGALPHKLVDPLLIASHIVVNLQQIVSRHARPGLPTVVSFGRFIAEGSVNVIPDEVKLEGTFRTKDEEWRARALQIMQKMIVDTASGMGGEAFFEVRRGYPVLINNSEITRLSRGIAEEYLGEVNVKDLDIRMTAEDFAYFSLQYPSVLYRLGVAPPGKEAPALHTANFNVDEKALELSMGLLARLAVSFG